MDPARGEESPPGRATPADRVWAIEYELDDLGPDVQLCLKRMDGRTYLTISGAHGVVFTGLHLTRASAQSLRRALDQALAEWQRMAPEPVRPELAALGQPTAHPEDRRCE